MAKAIIGTGRVTDFGKMEGAEIVPTRPSDQDEDREGFTVKRAITHIPNPKFAKGLAAPGGYDCLPGFSGT